MTSRLTPVLPTAAATVTLRPADGGRITGGLWRSRRAVNREVSIPDGYQRMIDAGNFHNLRLAAGTTAGEYVNDLPFLDSDVYKWLESVSWAQVDAELAPELAEELAARVTECVGLLNDAQQPDGYLQSYFQVNHPGTRYHDLQWGHDLYCAGHLIQAAIAQSRATGRTELLDVATRVADFVAGTLGPGKAEGVDGHPLIEMAMVELYRETGERRYLDLAQYFVDARGHGLLGECAPHGGIWGSRYWQDHAPVRTATEVTGHSVRQVYLLAGVVDLAVETGDAELLAAAQRLWTEMVAAKTYLTGGLGAHHTDEAFGDEYELPHERGYAETCAAIGSIMFSWRLLLATGQARYADLIERTLYNGFLSGVSLSGTEYAYVNPLQVRDGHGHSGGDGDARRTPWFRCACCPPNVMRTLASLEHYVLAVAPDGVLLHQYLPGEFRAGEVTLAVDTEYPWQGAVAVTVTETPAGPWTLTLRIPAWTTEYTISVNGEPVDSTVEDGWLRIGRAWQAGDTVRLDLAMPARLTAADPRVDTARGCLAIERGPLVYCVEQADLPAGVRLDDLVLAADAPLTTENRPDLLGGVIAVNGTARVRDRAAQADWWPYAPAGARSGHGAPIPFTAVPYHLWGNRAAGAMRVWLPTD